ncbi:hypothetical protein OQA88_9961 [Cercophora sp. LCS_1]
MAHSPDQGTAGCWVANDEWETHRHAIQELYQVQNRALKDVMRIMEDKHGFRATQRMYKTRIKSWGLDKNFKESEVVELFRLRRERDRVNKPTIYLIRGREVDWERVNTYVRRKGLDIAALIDAAVSSPSSASSSAAAREVTCRTPTPEPAGSSTTITTTSTLTATERFTSPASTTSSTFSDTATAVTGSGPISPRDMMRTQLPSMRTTPPPTTLNLTPDKIVFFQNFLTRVWETVMFEDGDRVWGTTEYWLRNTRSQEWIMTVRVKLALYRDYFSGQAGADDREDARTFRVLNRAFAILEPLSRNIIGTRMFYLVNFFFAFCALGPVSKRSNPFTSTVAQLVESVYSAGAAPPLGAGSGERSRGLGFGDADFGTSAGIFLGKVLEEMVGLMGVGVEKEAVLLLTEGEGGYPVLNGEPPATGKGRPGEGIEMGVWLLSRREDARAEQMLMETLTALDANPGREARALVRCAHFHLSKIWKRRGDEVRTREHMKRAVEGSLFFDSFVGWDEAEFMFA